MSRAERRQERGVVGQRKRGQHGFPGISGQELEVGQGADIYAGS